MHASISLRSKWRSLAVALVTVVILSVLTAGIALAQGHVANDGQTLETQSPEVQQLYTSVWGDNAAMRWVTDHNAAIGQVAPQAQHPRYDEVFHVAYMRSMDMELAGRITADVIARGTIDQFMAGMDMGVLYGYVAQQPMAAAAASSTSSTSSTPTTTTGTGLFEGASIADIDVVRGAADADAPAIPLLPVATVVYQPLSLYGVVDYDLSDLPVGMTCTMCTEELQIAGEPRDLGSYPMTWTATQTHPGEDGSLATEDDNLVVSNSLTFTIHVLSEPRPVTPDSVAMFADEMVEYTFFEGDYVQIFVAASGGVGVLTYSQTGLPEGLEFDGMRGEIYGTFDIAESTTAQMTITVMDGGELTDTTLSVMITMTANSQPVLVNPGPMPATVGRAFASAPLLAATATGGALNEPVEYSVSGLPDGLSFNSNRQIVGTPAASNVPEGDPVPFTVTYKVVDNDGQPAEQEFTITVSPSS